MKALHYRDGRIELLEVAKPVPAGREALVRIALAGICNTDPEIVRGYGDFQGTLGHEFVGVGSCGNRFCAGLRRLIFPSSLMSCF